ncbi:hypothetical protein ACE6H2_020714 [Prunus campanulata]
MKLLTGQGGGGGGGGGKTVAVGVKLDSHSKELLTWALIKVVELGDNFIAIHVLKDHLHTPSGKDVDDDDYEEEEKTLRVLL